MQKTNKQTKKQLGFIEGFFQKADDMYVRNGKFVISYFIIGD